MSVKFEIDTDDTEGYRRHFLKYPEDIRLYAPSVAEHIRLGICICCPAEPEGTCSNGHNLCRHCAEHHGCIACGLLG